MAAIGLGLLALVFFLRRKKKNNANAEKTSSTEQSPMPPGAQMSHQSYYDGSQAGYPPQQQQYMQTSPSPNQGFYPQGNTPPMPHNAQSPSASQMTDPRMSHVTTSPAPTWSPAYGNTPPPNQYQQQPVPFQPGGPQGHPQQLHEAPVDSSDQHRGEMHEMG